MKGGGIRGKKGVERGINFSLLREWREDFGRALSIGQREEFCEGH